MTKVILITLLFVHVILLQTSCSGSQSQVVIYTSVDQVFSEPIIKQFEIEYGVRVKVVYDTEASKTVGLEKRLIAEKNNPKADIFWNSEHLRTLRLKSAGLLVPYKGIGFDSIPSDFKDQDGYWTGFGARYRVFVINNDLVNADNAPRGIDSLLEIDWKGRVAVAKHYFGTTSTNLAALYARLGEKKYMQFLEGLVVNDVVFLSGNSHVRDAVARGEYAFGLTDTDDVSVAIDRGDNVSMVFAENYGNGTYAIPYTVAMIAGGPNPDNAHKFIDYLLSRKVIQMLVDAGALHGSIRADFDINTKYPQPEQFWQESSSSILDALMPSAEIARKILDK